MHFKSHQRRRRGSRESYMFFFYVLPLPFQKQKDRHRQVVSIFQDSFTKSIVTLLYGFRIRKVVTRLHLLEYMNEERTQKIWSERESRSLLIFRYYNCRHNLSCKAQPPDHPRALQDHTAHTDTRTHTHTAQSQSHALRRGVYLFLRFWR